MPAPSLQRPAFRLLDRIGPAIRRAPAWQVGLAAWALSTFVASPAFFIWSWKGFTTVGRSADYLRLCRNPLARDLGEPILAYRLTMPVLAWILHLPAWAALTAPYLVHVGFLAVCFAVLRRRLEATAAALTTVVIALSFALFWSNWKPGYTDTTSHLLAASMLLTPAAGWTFAATLLGLINDERMVLALPFVLCWHFSPAATTAWIRQSARWLLAAGLALGAYLVLRHGLRVGWIGPGIPTPAVYQGIDADLKTFRPHLGSWSVWALNVFLSFRWAWWLVIAFAGLLCRQKKWAPAAVFAGFLGFGVLASACVADVSRSIGYMTPAWLLAADGLAKERPDGLCVRLFWLVIALLFTPVFFTFEHFQVNWFRPLPLVLWRCFTGGDLAKFFH
ncbi:MAG TPA: hypothetical protein VMI53_13655 [Opitutaceae bacterium]|nr:hypothetical protein [Opitutaceae bacterium]